jgi:citronellyl-CoA dehydrogenase
MTTKLNAKSAEQIYFNEDHEMLRRTIRDFIEKEINPYIDDWEDTSAPLKEIFGKMGKLGLLGIRYDSEYGGQGLDYWYETVLLEELGNIKGLGVAMAIAVQTNMATPAMHDFGSEYLKETYLKPAIMGEKVAALAVTEPGAGSDVAGLRTTAKLDEDHYVINGSKTFITNGTQADFVVLLCRTSQEQGYHSFSLFVVPTDLPGFEISKELDKVGMRSSDTAELFFDNLRVPAKNIIGKEGEGFIYVMKQFQHERFSVLPMICTASQYIIKMTVEYLQQRITFGKTLSKRQVLRHRLAEWLTDVECLKQLTYHIVKMKMEGLDVTKEVSMGKLFAGQMSRKIADGCLQMFGGMGLMNETLISRFWRDARLTSIGGGTDEIMCEIISRLEGI